MNFKLHAVLSSVLDLPCPARNMGYSSMQHTQLHVCTTLWSSRHQAICVSMSKAVLASICTEVTIILLGNSSNIQHTRAVMQATQMQKGVRRASLCKQRKPLHLVRKIYVLRPLQCTVRTDLLFTKLKRKRFMPV